MRGVLIDTNIYSLALKGDGDVVRNMQRFELIAISVVSIGELLSGFKGGSREAKNREELYIFLDSPRVMPRPVDEETADIYASVLNNLRQQGTPIPTNDIWIAACAMQHGLKVYTRDRHFHAIPGIRMLET